MADAVALVDIVGRQSVSGPAGVAAGALSAVEAAAGKAGSVLGSLATAAVKTGAALGAIGAAGVVAGLTSAVTAAAGFEKQMSAVGAVSGASAAQMKDLSALALKLGADTSFSASESAQGIGELVKAGVSVADVMGGAAKASLDLAAAGGVDVATAAEIASNAMNVFSLKGKDMAHVADEIAGAANASAIDVNDYKFALSQSGAVAAQVGVSFDDLSVAIAEMGQAGIKGSDAGTSLRTFLLNLQPQTKKQIELSRELGLTTKEGGNAFFDASGHAKSMADISQVLQNALKGQTEQQKQATLQTLFGQDAIRAATILAKDGAGGFNEMAGAIGKVSAADVANTRLDNLAGSIEKFKGSAETAAITVGQHLTPPLRRLVDIGTDLLNRSLPALDRFGTVLGSTFDALITRVSGGAAVGPFFASLGRYLRAVAEDGDYLNDHLTELPPLFGTLARAIQYVEHTVLPAVGHAFVELGQVVGGFLGLELGDYAAGWDTWGGIVRRSLDLAGTAVGGVVAAIRSGFPVVRDTIAALLPIVVGLGRAFIDNIVTTVRFVIDRVLPPLISIIGQTATFFLGTLQPVLKSTGDVLRSILGDSLTWLADEAWPNLLDIMDQVAGFWQTAILPTLPQIADTMRQTLGETLYWLSTTVFPAFLKAADVAWQFIAGTIVPALPGAARVIRDVLGTAIEWIGTTGWPLLVSTGQAAMVWIAGTAIPALTSLADWLGPKISTVLSWVSNTGWPLMVAAGQAASTFITGTALPALSALWDWLSPKLQAALGWLTATGWPTLVTAATAVSDWITQTAIPALTPLVEWLGEKLKAAASWLIDTGWPMLVDAATKVSDWITGTAVPAVTSLWSWLEEKTRPAVQWFIDTGWPDLQKAGQFVIDMFTAMSDWAGRFWDKIQKTQTLQDLGEAFSKLWDAGKTLVEVFWPQMATGAQGSYDSVDPFVKLVEATAAGLNVFATGVKAIADGFKELKDALSGMPAPPDWFLNILRTQGIIGQAVGAVLPHQQAGASTNQPLPGRVVAGSGGPVDNSSLESFIRTAYPAALDAANGNQSLANHLLAIAVSENGAIGSGADLGATMGFNFAGVHAQPGEASFMATDAGRPTAFKQYPSLSAGLHGFMDFLQQNPRYAAALARYQQTGDVDQLTADANAAGYSETPDWQDRIRRIRQTTVEPITSTVAVDVAGSRTATSQRSGAAAGITSMNMADFAIGNQYELGLPKDQADAACGPAAVAIFMQMMGRTPNAEEVMRIAAKNGWTKEAGMGGPAAFARTLGDLAIEAAADFTPTRQEAQDQLLSGHATAFSTAGGNVPLSSGHYFVSQGYDTNTGKFDFGETAGPDPNDPNAQHALAHGSRYMTWDEVEAYAGPIQATISLLGAVPTVADNAERELNAVGLSLGTVRSAADVAAHTLDTSSAAIADAGTAARGATPNITTLGDTIGVGLGQAADAASTATGTIADTFADLPGDVLTSVTQLGDDTLTTMQDAMGNVIGVITDGAGNMVNQFVQLGPDSAAGLATGDPAIRGAVDRWGVGMLASLEAARQQAVAEANTVGQDVGGGIATGLDQSQDTISTALGDAVSGALDDLAKSFEIHSPSQKTRREVGHPLGHGIALGIGDTAGLVGDAMRSVVSLDGLGSGRMSSTAGGRDGGIDYDRLAAAITGAMPAAGPQLTVHGAGTDEVVAKVLRELRRESMLRGRVGR
jgi:TP901 family phage tail tape measure protein